MGREVVFVRDPGADHITAQGSSSGQRSQSDRFLRLGGVGGPRRRSIGKGFKWNPLRIGLFVREIGIGHILNHRPLAGCENIHRTLQHYQTDYQKQGEGDNCLDQDAAPSGETVTVRRGSSLELQGIWDKINNRVRAFLICGFLVVYGIPVLGATEPLQPPFGLNWGDSPARLVDWAVRKKLDQTIRFPAEDPQLKILEVSPSKGTLPGHDASRLEARFMDGRLFEVCLHYTYPGRNTTFVRGQFAELKRILSQRHGPLKLGAKTRGAPVAGVESQSVAYQLEFRSASSLMLVMTEVSDAKRGDQSARFSVVYHNGGEREQGEEQVIIRKEEQPASREP